MRGIITASDLATRLDDVKLADVRWYLGEPDRGHAEYHAGHIPGAVFVSLDHHLSAPEGPGRHPLPSRDEFAATMGRLGFGTEDAIVAYDDRGGVIAARLWWMLRDIGHEDVLVLDGGLPAWVESGGSVATGAEQIEPATMAVRTGETRSIDRAQLSERLGSVTLIDARAGDRYRGESEPMDPAAGHIPTAVNVPTSANLTEESTLRAPDRLEDTYRELGSENDVVVYCGSGVTACHDILAMFAAGLPEPMLYPGSWSDWSASGLPVATGAEPGS